MMMATSSAAPTPRLNAPSGIAQLRKSSEQNFSQPEPMNLDDFIYADGMGTPVDYSSPQPLSKQLDDCRSGLGAHQTLTSAIPIKSRRDSAAQMQQQDQFVPQSVPFPPQHQQKTRDEFNYLPRHTRKTSIDERRVSFPLLSLFLWLVSCPPGTGCIVCRMRVLSQVCLSSGPVFSA